MARSTLLKTIFDPKARRKLTLLRVTILVERMSHEYLVCSNHDSCRKDATAHESSIVSAVILIMKVLYPFLITNYLQILLIFLITINRKFTFDTQYLPCLSETLSSSSYDVLSSDPKSII
jgi:hypothetical protein